MYEGNLKTLCSLHYILIGICLVIILISLTESNLHLYNRVRDKLRLLNFIEKVYSNTLSDMYNSQYYRNIVLKNLRVDLFQKSKSKNVSTQVDTSTAMYTSTIGNPFVLSVDPDHLTIENLMSGLQEKQIDIVLKIPDTSQIATEATKYLSPNGKYSISKLDIKRLGEGGLLFDLILIDEMSRKPIEVQGTTELRSGRKKVPAPKIQQTMNTDINSPFSELDISQFDDLKSDAIWSEIFDKTPQEAIKWIETELQQKKLILTIQGIPIPTNLAVLFGPFLTFGTMLFICGHIRRIQSIYKNSEVLQNYSISWIALFDESVSRVLTLVTLLVAPSIVNIILLYRRYPVLSLNEKVIGIAFTVFIVITSYFMSRDLSSLRAIVWNHR